MFRLKILVCLSTGMNQKLMLWWSLFPLIWNLACKLKFGYVIFKMHSAKLPHQDLVPILITINICVRVNEDEHSGKLSVQTYKFKTYKSIVMVLSIYIKFYIETFCSYAKVQKQTKMVCCHFFNPINRNNVREFLKILPSPLGIYFSLGTDVRNLRTIIYLISQNRSKDWT